MIGYITLLKDEKNLSEEQKNKFVDVIYENIRYLNRLSEDFFSYLKFNLNEIPLNLTDVDIKIFLASGKKKKFIYKRSSFNFGVFKFGKQ